MSEITQIALTGTDKMQIEKIFLILNKQYGDKFCFNPVYSTSDQINSNKNLIDFWANYDAVFYIGEIENQTESFLDCWVGHPHFRFIDSKNALKNIEREINCIRENIELEKKYLIKMPNISALSKYKIFKTDIEQVYLISDTGSHRIRKRGANGVFQCFETLKIRINNEKCFEYENIITEPQYNELLKLADPSKNKIVKNRYCILYKSQYFELDTFPFWSDRALIELEIPNEDTQILLPPEISVIKDVSNDKMYKNNFLSTIDWDNYEDCKAYIL